MRYVPESDRIDGEIVIGEGEIDEAPMLYIGEKVGCGGDGVDIAVDPIDGTRMTAMGQNNAVAVLAAGDKGSFLKAPDMYMEKMIVGPRAKGLLISIVHWLKISRRWRVRWTNQSIVEVSSHWRNLVMTLRSKDAGNGRVYLRSRMVMLQHQC